MENTSPATVLPLAKWFLYLAIGALLASSISLVRLLTSLGQGWVIWPALRFAESASAGAAAGVMFAALWVLRRIGLIGYYLRWWATAWTYLYITLYAYPYSAFTYLTLHAYRYSAPPYLLERYAVQEWSDVLGVVSIALVGVVLGVFAARLQLTWEAHVRQKGDRC